MSSSRSNACFAAIALVVGTAMSVSPAYADNRLVKVRVAIDQLYRPAYERFAAESLSLLDSTVRLCRVASKGEVTTSSTAALVDARGRFVDTVAAFSRVELLRVGPIVEHNRLNRLFYWPDTRRVTGRQLSALLATRAGRNGRPTVRSLQGESVAVQGLPALERLLFTTELADISSDRSGCALSMDIAGNISALAGALAGEWTDEEGIVSDLLRPTIDSPLFRDDEEVTRSLLSQVGAGLESMATRKARPMSEQGARWRNAPFSLSGATLINLRGNLESMQALLELSGMVDRARLKREIAFEFRIARSHLDRLGRQEGFADPGGFVTPATRESMQALRTVVSGLASTVVDRIAPALRVQAGFNGADGD